MFDRMLSAFLLLCSATAISASDQKNYIMLINDAFQGKKYTHTMNVTPEEFKNVNEMEKWVKQCACHNLLNKTQLPANVTFYPAIEKMFLACIVDFFCVNKSNNKTLEITDPQAEQGLRAGTHQLRAVIFSRKEAY